jgi:2-dehydropantoate 2-reductase
VLRSGVQYSERVSEEPGVRLGVGLMNIAIMGSGAIGCFLAARLIDCGHEVTLIGRPSAVSAIVEHGLLVRERDGRQRHYHPRAVERLEETPELVLLAVKTQDVPQACRALLPVAARAPVVVLQNGVRADGLAADLLDRQLLLGAVVLCAVSYTQPGEIEVQFPGWLILGEPSGPPKARTRTIARVVGEAMPTYLTRDLKRTRWTKLVFNLNNGICAATGLTLPEVGASPLGRRLSVRAMREGVAVAHAAGVRLDHTPYGLSLGALRRSPSVALVGLMQGALNLALESLPELAAMRVLGAASRSQLNRIPLRGSTWQSIARGRPSEIEYLNGEIVRTGRMLGVETPYNTRLVDIVGEVEREHTFQPLEALLPGNGAPVPAASQPRSNP